MLIVYIYLFSDKYIYIALPSNGLVNVELRAVDLPAADHLMVHNLAAAFRRLCCRLSLGRCLRRHCYRERRGRLCCSIWAPWTLQRCGPLFMEVRRRLHDAKGLRRRPYKEPDLFCRGLLHSDIPIVWFDRGLPGTKYRCQSEGNRRWSIRLAECQSP